MNPYIGVTNTQTYNIKLISPYYIYKEISTQYDISTKIEKINILGQLQALILLVPFNLRFNALDSIDCEKKEKK